MGSGNLNREDSTGREDRYQSLVQSVNGIVWESDADTFEFTYVSPQSEEILGYPPSRWYGDSSFWKEHIHPEDRERAVRYCHHKAQKGENHTFEYRMLADDGSVVWLRDMVTVVCEEGEPVLLRGLMTDITEIKKAERERELERRDKEALINSTSDLIWSVTPDMKLMAANTAFLDTLEKLAGRRLKVGDDLTELENHDDAKFDQWLEHIRRALEGESYTVQTRNDRLQENPLWFETTLNPIREGGRIVGIACYARNITERRKYEEKLEQLSLVASKTTDVIIITDADDRITWVNKAFEELTGYRFEEAVGKNPGELLQGPDTDPETVKRLSKAVRERESIQEVILNYTKEGEKYWLDMTINPIFNEEGECTDFIAIEKDVTEQKEHEVRIRDALKEKETLLAEIHHRVKNNLAVVSGMMQLQAFEEEDEEMRSKLLDCVVRIGSMAHIHEQLYQSNSFSRLNFSRNLESLIDSIIDTIQDHARIEVQYELVPLELNVNQAIPSSLIVNEVITNILKHAFREREKGRIEVTLSEEKGKIVLRIADDGVGLPDDFEVEDSQTLGLNLINTLAEQLQAEYSYRSPEDMGSEFHLKFEKSELKGAGSAQIM